MLKVYVDPETGDILKSYEMQYVEIDADFSLSDEIVFDKVTKTILLKEDKVDSDKYLQSVKQW